MFRELAIRYGWTPGQVADLTPIQATIYLSDEARLRGRVKIDSASDERQFWEMVRLRRETTGTRHGVRVG